MNRSFAKWKSGLALTLPSFLFVFAFLVYPIVYLITLSFKEYSPLRSTEQRFIGLENYTWVLGSDNVIHSFKVTLGFTVLSVLIEMAVGLVIALFLSHLMLDGRSRLKRWISSATSSIFILPFAVPAIAAAVAWKMLLHPQFGPVNAILGVRIAWFTQFPLLSVVVADAWKMTPMVLFLILAGIMSIDPDQFEAARIDGANTWQEFIYLTIPSILPVLLVTAAFRAVDAFTKVFDIIYMTTGGGPGNDTEVFPLLIWKTAFSHLHFGRAAALAIVAILISAVLGGLLVFRRRSA